MEDHLLRDYLTRSNQLVPALPCSRSLPEHFCNPFDNGIDLAQYFGVPESQYVISAGAQESASVLIFLCVQSVLRAIDFDEQVSFQANEVDEIRAD